MNELRYHYSGFGAGYLTLAYKVSGDRNSNVRTVKFGFAFCSPKDRFSKKDVVKKTTKTRWNPSTNSVEVLETKIQVVPGGRTRALDKFNTNPVEMTVSVDNSKSAILQIIDAMTDYCWNRAPSWKNKVRHHVSRKGNHILSVDGFTLRFAEKDSNYLIQLDTPYGETELV